MIALDATPDSAFAIGCVCVYARCQHMHTQTFTVVRTLLAALFSNISSLGTAVRCTDNAHHTQHSRTRRHRSSLPGSSLLDLRLVIVVADDDVGVDVVALAAAAAVLVCALLLVLLLAAAVLPLLLVVDNVVVVGEIRAPATEPSAPVCVCVCDQH
jgi:hypothetical protein